MKTYPTKILLLFFGMLVIAIAAVNASENDSRDTHMQNMRDHMTSMHAQMQAIHAEKDPEKRQQLMQAHRESMHKGMEMMHEMGGEGKMGMHHRHKQQAKKKAENTENHRCMERMEHRVDAMQMMMEQMMMHEDAHRHHARR